jgi:hypothetical protein
MAYKLIKVIFNPMKTLDHLNPLILHLQLLSKTQNQLIPYFIAQNQFLSTQHQ